MLACSLASAPDMRLRRRQPANMPEGGEGVVTPCRAAGGVVAATRGDEAVLPCWGPRGALHVCHVGTEARPGCLPLEIVPPVAALGSKFPRVGRVRS